MHCMCERFCMSEKCRKTKYYLYCCNFFRFIHANYKISLQTTSSGLSEKITQWLVYISLYSFRLHRTETMRQILQMQKTRIRFVWCCVPHDGCRMPHCYKHWFYQMPHAVCHTLWKHRHTWLWWVWNMDRCHFAHLFNIPPGNIDLIWLWFDLFSCGQSCETVEQERCVLCRGVLAVFKV